MQSANAMRGTAVYADHTHQKTASANQHIENKTNILGECKSYRTSRGQELSSNRAEEPNKFGSEIGA